MLLPTGINGVPYGNRTRVVAVKEKRFVGTQRKLCGMDSTRKVDKGTLRDRYWTLNGARKEEFQVPSPETPPFYEAANPSRISHALIFIWLNITFVARGFSVLQHKTCGGNVTI